MLEAKTSLWFRSVMTLLVVICMLLGNAAILAITRNTALITDIQATLAQVQVEQIRRGGSRWTRKDMAAWCEEFNKAQIARGDDARCPAIQPGME